MKIANLNISKVQLLAAIIVAGLVIVGGVIYFISGNKNIIPQQTAKVPEEKDLMAGVEVSAPAFDFSVSPLNAVDLSAFNLSPSLTSDLFSAPGVSATVSYASSVSLALPSVNLTMPTDFNIEQSAPPTQETTPSQGQVNASNCAQFSAVPSCTYVSDPNGQTLCNQCKAAGF